jgi:hypothetical protein
MKLLWCPRTGGALHGVPDLIEGFEPAVGGGLVTDSSPDAFLHVQGRLIGGQVTQPQPWVSAQELTHGFAFVPTGAVDIESDLVALQAPIEVPEHGEEAVAVSVFGADHAVAVEQGCHPAGKVETSAVLAGGGYAQALPAFGPATAEARMQGEAGFVLKDHGLISLEMAQFFLEPVESGACLASELEGRRDWRASCGSRVGAANSGLGAP